MSAKVPSRSVFVGNIPYGVSEEQIIDIFGRVGRVVGFRLVHDKDSGKPKGFGFLEYNDTDTAAAAVRNLNDFDIMGRKLRVDWSNDSGSGGGQQAPDGYQAQSNGPTTTATTTTDAGALPPLPAGIENVQLSSPDAISQTLSVMPAPQLLDLISQMKGMVAENPAQVTQLFTVAPQLAYAIFQALLLLGLTDTSVLSSIIQATAPQAAAPAPPPPQQFVPPPQAAPNPYAGYPQYQQSHVPTPPVQHTPYQQPPQQAPPPAQLDQAALIQQVLQMTAAQIYALPPMQRDQILQLRTQLGAPVS